MKQLIYENQEPGMYTILWDGTDMNGYVVSGGLYLYRLKVNDFIETKKMLFLK